VYVQQTRHHRHHLDFNNVGMLFENNLVCYKKKSNLKPSSLINLHNNKLFLNLNNRKLYNFESEKNE
jgi:hypothetical protein